ncbi:hypothetical protein U1Q18_007243 [Sarracenia purpurea var. burkii]
MVLAANVLGVNVYWLLAKGVAVTPSLFCFHTVVIYCIAVYHGVHVTALLPTLLLLYAMELVLLLCYGGCGIVAQFCALPWSLMLATAGDPYSFSPLSLRACSDATNVFNAVIVAGSVVLAANVLAVNVFAGCWPKFCGVPWSPCCSIADALGLVLCIAAYFVAALRYGVCGIDAQFCALPWSP